MLAIPVIDKYRNDNDIEMLQISNNPNLGFVKIPNNANWSLKPRNVGKIKQFVFGYYSYYKIRQMSMMWQFRITICSFILLGESFLLVTKFCALFIVQLLLTISTTSKYVFSFSFTIFYTITFFTILIVKFSKFKNIYSLIINHKIISTMYKMNVETLVNLQ